MFDYYDTTTGEGLTDYELHARFDDWLDELGPAVIAGMEYSASYALRAVSDVDYRVSYCDWINSELEDGRITETPPQVDGSVCVDCVMAIANGDTSGNANVEDWAARIDATDPTEGGKYDVVVTGDESHFGTSRCDYCATTLHGDRFDVAFIAR
jgi:hypothetical protein